jgi:hypothetical protein
MKGEGLMEFNTNRFEKRFIKISNDSGCFLASYKHMQDYENSEIIIYNDNEKSGIFKLNSKFE